MLYLHTEHTTKYTYTRKANNPVVNKTKQQDLKTIGQWTWNSKLLNEKVIKGEVNDCWPADNFSQTKHGPLFGCRKNNRPQMTQLARVLYRDWFNEDCENKEITHACNNRNCINPDHWLVRDVKIHGARPNQVKQAQAKPVKNKWWPK